MTRFTLRDLHREVTGHLQRRAAILARLRAEAAARTPDLSLAPPTSGAPDDRTR